MLHRNGVIDAVEELNFRPTRLLRQPDLAHGGELVFAHHHTLALIELQSIGDGVNSGRSTGDNCNLGGIGIDEARELRPQRLILTHPLVPRRRRRTPAPRVSIHAGLHGV